MPEDPQAQGIPEGGTARLKKILDALAPMAGTLGNMYGEISGQGNPPLQPGSPQVGGPPPLTGVAPPTAPGMAGAGVPTGMVGRAAPPSMQPMQRPQAQPMAQMPLQYPTRGARTGAAIQSGIEGLTQFAKQIQQQRFQKAVTEGEAVAGAVLAASKSGDPRILAALSQSVAKSKVGKDILKLVQARASGDLDTIEKLSSGPAGIALQRAMQAQQQQEDREQAQQMQKAKLAETTASTSAYQAQAVHSQAQATQLGKPPTVDPSTAMQAATKTIDVLAPDGTAKTMQFNPQTQKYDITVGPAPPPGTTSLEAAELKDWLSKNPGKGPADFMVYKSQLSGGGLEREAVRAYAVGVGKKPEELKYTDFLKIRSDMTDAGASALTAQILQRQNHLSDLIEGRQKGLIDYRVAAQQTKTFENEYLRYNQMLSVMQGASHNIEQAIKTKANPGPYDVVLLSNHIAMTYGSVKGARIGTQLIAAHVKARSLPESVERTAQGVLRGDQLTPSQRAAYLQTAIDRVNASRSTWEAAKKGLGTGPKSELDTELEKVFGPPK